MTRQQILRLGMDMCQALIACERANVIHRDIKVDNVFFNGFDSFKLGDFGISKQLEKTQSALSQKGTNMYMAPEVFRAEKYDHTVDIYSLGIMLYRLLNRGVFHFSLRQISRCLPMIRRKRWRSVWGMHRCLHRQWRMSSCQQSF